jgi:hypothetical protein
MKVNADVATATAAAYDASRPVFADVASAVTAAALDASRPVFADTATASASAYDGTRPAFADVAVDVAVAAYDASVAFEVIPDSPSVTTSAYLGLVYRGAAQVRVLQVPPENRTFVVRR